MGKYDALGAFLRRWKTRHEAADADLSFLDVERIIGALLPRGAHHPDWWRNQPDAVQCRAWLEAGFEAHPFQEAERVRFSRIALPH